MSEKIKQAVLAKLNDCNNDLSKQWFVYFSARNPETQKLQRVKIYEGFAKLATVAERKEYARKLIRETNEKLNKGWNPLAERQIIYQEDQTFPNVANALTEVLKEQKINLRKKSYQSYESHLRGFCSWLTSAALDGLPVNEFCAPHASLFIEHLVLHKKLSTTTRNAYLRTLKTLFSKLLDKEVLLKNPFGRIKKIGHNNRGALYFQENQVKILKEAICNRNPQLWFFIQFMYYCYIRPSEIRCLKVGDIHGDKIQVRGEISKNKKTEYVAIPKPFLQVIKLQGILNYPENFYIFGRDGKPGAKNYSVNHFSYNHLKILRELRLSNQHKFYSWKHTGVVTAYKNGADLKELQMQLRHHSLDMVNKYMRDLGVMDSDFFKNRFPEI